MSHLLRILWGMFRPDKIIVSVPVIVIGDAIGGEMVSRVVVVAEGTAHQGVTVTLGR